MGPEHAPRVSRIRVRANPEYELVLLDCLSDKERRLLDSLSRDPECYGILRARNDASLTIKAVSRDTALLLSTLERPMMLPRYAIRQMEDECDSVIGAMIADGILEAELDGRMMAGPAAYRAIFGESALPAPEGFLGALSRRAIEYADALEIYDADVLAARLYSYNRIPNTPAWKRRLPDAGAVETFLGLNGAHTMRLLDREWLRVPQTANAAWISFRSLRHRVPAGEIHKLYVSPRCEALAETIDAVVRVLPRFEVFHWKVGRDLAGLLRPDKIVIHACDAAAVRELAAELRERLANCPAHGVPFTAEIVPSGLLSRGVDPPSEESLGLQWLEGESWRVRVCRRLAAALVAAKRMTERHVSPVSYALDRLHLEKVDTNTWAPQQ